MTTKTGKQGGNLEALRKEIDLNEKLQKQIEVYRQKLAAATHSRPTGEQQSLPDATDMHQQPWPSQEKMAEPEARPNEVEDNVVAQA